MAPRGGLVRQRPAGILAARPVLSGLLSGAVYNFTLYGMLLVYTFHFQDARQYSAARTGLAFLPLTLTAVAATSLIGGRFAARLGRAAGVRRDDAVRRRAGHPRRRRGTGPLPAARRRIRRLLAGYGLTDPAQTLAVMTFTPDKHKNMASSALNSARQAGGVTGVALLGALSTAHPSTGLPVAMLLAMAASLITAINARRHIPAGGPQARSDHPVRRS